MSGHPKQTQPRHRESVFLMARITDEQGEEQARHVVRNLSATGACIVEPGPLQKGQQLTLAIGTVAGIAAEVVWARGGFAGLRFDTPIDVAQARRPVAKSARRASDAQAGWLTGIRQPYQRPTG